MYEIEEGTVVVECDGRVLAWSDGVFTGDKEMQRYATLAISTKSIVTLEGALEVECDGETALGALGAMFVFCPGRTHVVECPAYVKALLASARTLVGSEDPSAWGSHDEVESSDRLGDTGPELDSKASEAATGSAEGVVA